MDSISGTQICLKFNVVTQVETTEMLKCWFKKFKLSGLTFVGKTPGKADIEK